MRVFFELHLAFGADRAVIAEGRIRQKNKRRDYDEKDVREQDEYE